MPAPEQRRPPLGELEYALQRSIRKGKIDEVWNLVRQGADVNQIDPIYGRSALHWAAVPRSVDYLNAVLSTKAKTSPPDLDLQDDKGDTPIHVAMTHHGMSQPHVKRLVLLGARIDILNAKDLLPSGLHSRMSGNRLISIARDVFRARAMPPPRPTPPRAAEISNASATVHFRIPTLLPLDGQIGSLEESIAERNT